MKFAERFEKNPEINKAVYLPHNLHLSIFYNKEVSESRIRTIVANELGLSNLQNSVETISFYPEEAVMSS